MGKITNKNIAIIVLDALRYDSTTISKCPNFDSIFNKYGWCSDSWVKVYTNGTYTLPVHIAMFKSGHLPSNNIDSVPKIYSRPKKFRIFNAKLNWTKYKDTLFPTPEAPNIVKGFSRLGYRTVGIGGVDWFSNKFLTSNFWNEYFEEFYWQESFGAKIHDGFENQIKKTSALAINKDSPLFFYLNVATAHNPCRGSFTLKGQARALEYIDSHINDIIDILPKPCFAIVLSDHGTLFGDECGLKGHGFYHPKIIEVPIIYLDIN